MMSEVKLISDYFVRPKHEVDESKKKSYLTPEGFNRLMIEYIHIGLLFAKPSSSSPTILSLLENLKLSLSLTLVHLYPLAGQLVTEKYEDDQQSCHMFIDCHKGPGAKLIHATALHRTVVDILAPNEDVPPVTRSFFDMGERSINYDGHTRPLLTVQVTELSDGVFIGYTMNHSVADGCVSMHLLKVWSEIFTRLSSRLSASLTHVPILQEYKSLFPDGCLPIIKLSYFVPKEFINQSYDHHDQGQVRERIFYFSQASLAKLKAKANANYGTSNISSLQALSALVWMSIIRARKPPLNATTTYSLVIDFRSRFEPPLSDDYFGTFIKRVNLTIKVSELFTNSLSEIALRLHELVMGQDGKVAEQVFKEPFIKGSLTLPQKSSPSGPNSVLMGGSNRFDMYGLDFGLGKPVAFRTGGQVNKADGRVRVIAGSLRDGSVELEVNLKADTMNSLLTDDGFMSYCEIGSGFRRSSNL